MSGLSRIFLNSALFSGKKLVYQLRIADIQQQQNWTSAIQEQFRRLFHSPLSGWVTDISGYLPIGFPHPMRGIAFGNNRRKVCAGAKSTVSAANIENYLRPGKD